MRVTGRFGFFVVVFRNEKLKGKKWFPLKDGNQKLVIFLLEIG